MKAYCDIEPVNLRDDEHVAGADKVEGRLQLRAARDTLVEPRACVMRPGLQNPENGARSCSLNECDQHLGGVNRRRACMTSIKRAWRRLYRQAKPIAHYVFFRGRYEIGKSLV